MENNEQSSVPPEAHQELEVIFIRHAETQENVRINALFSILTGLLQLRLPSFEQLSHVAHLVFLKEENSDLSARGTRQLLDMQQTLQSTQFWENNPFDVCYYSPYVRAEKTCKMLLPASSHANCQTLDLLKEIPFYAHLSSKLREKTCHLEAFLAHHHIHTASTKRVVLVGHCKFFHTLLHPPGSPSSPSELMWNCDIVRATMRVSSSGGTSWSSPQLLLRSPLSTAHPASALLRYRVFQGALTNSDPGHAEMGASQGGSRPEEEGKSANHGDNNNEDGEEDELICRICHGPATPSMPLCSPCKCKGSVRYVHVQCLNMWRAHSNNHSCHACGICGYVYQVRQSWGGKALGVLLDADKAWLRYSLAALALLCMSIVAGMAVKHVLLDLGWKDGKDWLHYCLHIANWGEGANRGRGRGVCHPNVLRLSPALPPQFTLPLLYHHTIHPLLVSLYCNPFWNNRIGEFLLGLLAVGWTGQIVSWVRFVWRLVQGAGAAQGWGAMGLTYVWFGSSDRSASLRVWAALGLVNVVMWLAEGLESTARKLSAQFCPDEVLSCEE